MSWIFNGNYSRIVIYIHVYGFIVQQKRKYLKAYLEHIRRRKTYTVTKKLNKGRQRKGSYYLLMDISRKSF